MKESPLLALAEARIKSFFREPGAVFWTFGFPLLITVALGVAFRNQGPGRATVAVVGGADAPALARAWTPTRRSTPLSSRPRGRRRACAPATSS